MTFDLNQKQWDHLLSMDNPLAKYEIPNSYGPVDMVFTMFTPFDLW